MRYGISAAALIVRDDSLLLVHHREKGKYDFWVPPGGSLKGCESILDCVRRETFEETGLTIEPGEILYIQEFYEPEYHFCKFFILARSFKGHITINNKDADEGFLVEARFFSRLELVQLNVFPTIMKDEFWKDIGTLPSPTRYLGLEKIRF